MITHQSVVIVPGSSCPLIVMTQGCFAGCLPAADHWGLPQTGAISSLYNWESLRYVSPTQVFRQSESDNEDPVKGGEAYRDSNSPWKNPRNLSIKLSMKEDADYGSD